MESACRRFDPVPGRENPNQSVGWGAGTCYLAYEIRLTRWGAFRHRQVNILITELAKPVASKSDTNALVAKYGADNTKLSGVDLSPSIVYLWLGDFDAVGEHSGESSGSTDEILAWEHARPGWRNSAGFKRLLLTIGVLEYWREQGFPPQCRAVGANDFACDEVQR